MKISTSKNTKLEKRMYFLTMYNISPIQQGIQCGHAALRYARKYNNKDTWDFVDNHETWIILNGGTSGTMEEHYKTLTKMDVQCVKFNEPDLNMSLSAIAFIVDERVFNRDEYPDFHENPDEETYYLNTADYIKCVGGKKNYELRKFLKQFRMA